MDRLHRHVRLTAPSILVLTALLFEPGCASDETHVPEELRGEPVCMWIAGTRVHYADGSVRVIRNERTSITGAACLCMSEEEYAEQTRLDELNDLALDRCFELAGQYDHVWNECQQAHDEQRWYDIVFWSVGDSTHPKGEALGCQGH
jgi:hypothetical protein